VRTVIVSVIGISSLFLVVMIQQKINVKTWEREELEESMATAMKQTLSEVMEKNSYGIQNRNEMLAAFLQTMLYKLRGDVDLTVKIHRMDYELGQMDVEAIGIFRRANGETRHVSVRRQMVFAANT
jgi:hypothetical protein